MKFKNRVKNFDLCDIASIKWSAIVFSLFLISAWPGLANWVAQTHWGWFLVISLALGIRPLIRFFKG